MTEAGSGTGEISTTGLQLTEVQHDAVERKSKSYKMKNQRASQKRKKNGRPRGKVPSEGAMIALRVGKEYRDYLNQSARRAGLSTRQFILRAIDREINEI